MKASMKWLSVLLTLCLITSSILVVTTAASGSAESVQDGVRVSLNTSKDTYSASDAIDLTLSVTNNSGRVLTNVGGLISIPASVTVNTGILSPSGPRSIRAIRFRTKLF